MSQHTRLLKLSLALTVLSLASLFVLAKVAHYKGKRPYILSSLRKVLPSFESPPDGYPVTVVTRKKEKIYFHSVQIEFVDAWHPEQAKPDYFRLETDSAGQLEVSTSLEGVTEFRVLALPAFSRKPIPKPEASPQDSKLGFDPSALGNGGNFGGNHLNPALRRSETSKSVEYVPLRCRVSLKFDTGRVFEGRVTVHHVEYENRISGATPEGTRCLSLSDIDLIKDSRN